MSLGRIRHMPVVDADGRLCGVVSQRDLFRGALAAALGLPKATQARLLGALLVREVMNAQPITTTPETPITEAAEVMLRRKVGCLPVLDGESLVGILTEADFVRHVVARR